MLLSSLLFFVYLNATAVVVSFIGGILIVVFHLIEFLPLLLLSIGMALLIILIFWGGFIRTKRIKAMMASAKKVSRRMYLMLNWISVVSVVVSCLYLPFYAQEPQSVFAHALWYANWICTIWWFSLLVTFIWKTAKYVFSEMKITLLDGEVIQYSCSPQMCRVHKNYIRLLKRDDKGTIIYERHINEASVKQIEYL